MTGLAEGRWPPHFTEGLVVASPSLGEGHQGHGDGVPGPVPGCPVPTAPWWGWASHLLVHRNGDRPALTDHLLCARSFRGLLRNLEVGPPTFWRRKLRVGSEPDLGALALGPMLPSLRHAASAMPTPPPGTPSTTSTWPWGMAEAPTWIFTERDGSGWGSGCRERPDRELC